MKTIYWVIASIALLTLKCVAADPPTISVSRSSIRVNGKELRTGSKSGTGHYISLDSTKKALGKVQDVYEAGLGVTVFSWPAEGIQVQRGFRGEEKGKIFKFQVWFEDLRETNGDIHSGKFNGHIVVDGVDIPSNATFDTIRPKLQEAGFQITENLNTTIASKDSTSIITVDKTNKIQLVEVWCN